MTEPHVLSLAGLTPLHRSMLAHKVSLAVHCAGPWFRDSWVSVDNLADLGPTEWDRIDEVIGLLVAQYDGDGSDTAAQYQAIRDDFAALTARIEATDRALRQARQPPDGVEMSGDDEQPGGPEVVG